MQQGIGPAAGQQDCRPAVNHRLGRADADDHVRLDELSCDPQGPAFVVAELDQLRVLDVVHDHLPVERPREGRREQPVELPASRASRQPGSDENRLALVGYAEVSQFLDGRTDGRTPRIDRRARQRQRRHVGDDRRPSSFRHDACEGRA